jgi:hypothetical protein
MAQNSEVKKLIIPYFIALGFVAVSISSIARGIDNHEIWRIITAGIGGSFFLGVAVLIIVRLIKTNGIRKPDFPGVFRPVTKLGRQLKEILTGQGIRRRRQ